MVKLRLDNAQKLANSNEEHQTRTKEMTRDHNSKVQHLAHKIAEKKAEFERLQEEHDELFKRMKREHEDEKHKLEEDLRTRRDQLLADLYEIGQERRELDAEFETREREMEMLCVDEFFRMNWKNEKGGVTRGGPVGTSASGQEKGGNSGQSRLRRARGAAEKGGRGHQPSQEKHQRCDRLERATPKRQVE